MTENALAAATIEATRAGGNGPHQHEHDDAGFCRRPPARSRDEIDADGVRQTEHQRMFAQTGGTEGKLLERIRQQSLVQGKFHDGDECTRRNENQQRSADPFPPRARKEQHQGAAGAGDQIGIDQISGGAAMSERHGECHNENRDGGKPEQRPQCAEFPTVQFDPDR